MRISRALPRRAGPGGTSAQIRPSMCQSSGCSAIDGGERVGDRLHRAGHPVAQPARAVDRHLRVDDQPPAALGEPADGRDAAPRRSARRAAPARRAWSPAGRRTSTGTPPLPRSRSTSRQVDAAVGRATRGAPSVLGRAPPVSGTTRMPRDSPVVDEPPVQRLGLEPLGHGHERAAEPVDEPDAGGVPVAAVRQRHDQRRGPRRAPAPGARRRTTSVPPTIRSLPSVGSRNASCQ